jgi:hypothetical protein
VVFLAGAEVAERKILGLEVEFVEFFFFFVFSGGGGGFGRGQKEQKIFCLLLSPSSSSMVIWSCEEQVAARNCLSCQGQSLLVSAWGWGFKLRQ